MTVVIDGDAMERMNMSARAYDCVLKVARTIADLEGTHDVLTHHNRGAHQPTATWNAPTTSICNVIGVVGEVY